jgi:hypothetical protein
VKTRSPDNAELNSASDAMRKALTRQLGEGAQPAGFDVPPVIPDHTLLHRVGHGAYGDVWLARNALGTLRAVKVVYRAHFEEDRPYEREFRGIVHYEPISRTHEGLVQVLHVGRNDAAGCFYYVMEAADAAHERSDGVKESWSGGQAANALRSSIPTPQQSASYRPRTLHSELALHQRLPPADAAQLVLQLAAALGHLHRHGLVHRDVKPSNVIFVGGQPKLADIGLVTGAGTSHTFVGTEGFIPPEGPGTAQADLYALGKLLYELATGHDRMEFPQLPGGVARLPEGEAVLELNEVVTRACAPEPKDRYARAQEFQADINLFLAGRSLRRVRTLEHRYARLRLSGIVGTTLLACAVVAVFFANHRARLAAESRAQETRLREQAQSLQARAERAERESRQQLYAALLEQARATIRSGELGQRVNALEAGRRAAVISNSAALLGVALAAQTLPDLRFERELPYGAEFTLRLVDPSFERIALCRGSGAIEIRSTSDQRLLATLPASTNLPAHYAEWSLDGRFLAVKRDHASWTLAKVMGAWLAFSKGFNLKDA